MTRLRTATFAHRHSIRALSFTFMFAAAFLTGTVSAVAQAYTSIVVIGDSLSDTGNDAAVSGAIYGPSAQVPSPNTGYTQGRFTDGLDTAPAARNYTGVWVEQLAAKLAAHPAVINSLAGGTNYAYGFATTGTGTSSFTYGPGNALSFPVNNMGQQVSDYLATKPTITNKTLFIVWGGANDLINATSSSDIVNAATREIGIVQTLIGAGATDILLVNLPPLGLVPRFNGSPTASAAATAAAQGFDQALAYGYSQLAASVPSANIRFLDTYTLFNTIVGPPIATGLANVTASSQFNTTVNPDTYLFWDDLHPTTFGHSLIAAAALRVLGTPVMTTTTVTSSNNNANLKASVTFTASVTGTTGTPMGTVTFLDGTTVLGSALLFGTTPTATAMFTTATLAAGPHNITASYAADNGYLGSTSTVYTQTVTAPAYTTSLSPSSITLTRGGSVNVMVSIVTVGGLTGSFTVACGTLPAEYTCTPATTTVTVNSNTTTTATLAIGNTVHASADFPSRTNHTPTTLFAFLGLPLFGGVAFVYRRKRSIRSLLSVLALAFAAIGIGGMGGCSGSSPAGTGTYAVPIIVTPSSGQATTLTLNVTVP